MVEPCVCAVDPGLTGAIAFLFPSAVGRVSVDDMPLVNGMVDPHALRRRLEQMGPTLCVIEQVNAMPSIAAPGGKRRTMGAQSAFNFGDAFATARTVLALSGAPLHIVTPGAWKRHHNVPGKSAGGEEAARALALRLFPGSADLFARKKDHGRADAALLAAYAAQTILPLHRTAREAA